MTVVVVQFHKVRSRVPSVYYTAYSLRYRIESTAFYISQLNSSFVLKVCQNLHNKSVESLKKIREKKLDNEKWFSFMVCECRYGMVPGLRSDKSFKLVAELNGFNLCH